MSDRTASGARIEYRVLGVLVRVERALAELLGGPVAETMALDDPLRERALGYECARSDALAALRRIARDFGNVAEGPTAPILIPARAFVGRPDVRCMECGGTFRGRRDPDHRGYWYPWKHRDPGDTRRVCPGATIHGRNV